MNEPDFDFKNDPSIDRDEEIDRVCDAFEMAWRAGRQPRIDEYLASVPEDRRPRLSRHLVDVERELRQAANETPAARDPQPRSPEGRDAAVDSTANMADTSGVDDDLVTGAREDRIPHFSGYIGRYKLERVLGEGGFGRVYLARDTELERRVAIKVPRREFLTSAREAAAYRKEARTVAQLDHPHIVPVYDSGSTDQFPVYIVSKYVEGCDLATRLKRGRFSHADSAELVSTVAEALQHAHQQGLVHRDIKPANILLDPSDTPFILDFGLALTDRELGKELNYAGTPAYMSPEQARGEGHRVDGRSDIFSLGVVLYELIVGTRPFKGTSRDEIVERIVEYAARPPRQYDQSIPPELERICLKALSKRPAERYLSASDLAGDLRRSLGGETAARLTHSPAAGHPVTSVQSPRALISYARSDGGRVAESLRQRLAREQSHIELWRDPQEPEDSLDWWKGIHQALHEITILIMVMTPSATASAIMKRKWQYARQQGVRVCPVVAAAAGARDLSGLPQWMSKARLFDLDNDWDEFVYCLNTWRRGHRVPFMAPDLRKDFVHRPLEFDALLAGLLDRARLNPVAISTAVQGSGGFGKTTLAIALCHDERVIAAFDDGILWCTLGTSPNIQNQLTKMYASLTGERPPFVDDDDAAIALATQLEGKNCLIVIDDVWDPNHVEHFMRGGKQCARLITTRRRKVATVVGAERVNVDEMTEDQAVVLLSPTTPIDPSDLRPLKHFARRLGEWPLLLALASTQLQERIERGDTLRGALLYSNRALDKRGIVAFDPRSTSSRQAAVAYTVQASLELLRPEDRVRCAELAIFPEDTIIPLTAVSALWSLDEFETEEMVEQLDGAALVDFDLKARSIRIHDVLRSYFRTQLDSTKAIHERLVHSGWRNLKSLPDSYAWRWIGWHLTEAGEYETLHSLLLDFEWLKTKLQTSGVEALLRDFDYCARSHSKDLRQVCDVIRLAAPGLSQDYGQLSAQLLGRLRSGASPRVDKLLADARRLAPRPLLALRHRSLTHPGGPLISIFKGHAASVEGLALTKDGRCALSASLDGTVRIWDVPVGRSVGVLEGHAGPVHCVAVTPDGQRAVSGSEDRSLHVWDVQREKLEIVLREHAGAVRGVAISGDGELLASVSEDGSLRMWEFSCLPATRVVFRAQLHQLRALALVPDARQVVFCPGDWSIMRLGLDDGRVLHTYEGHEGVVRQVVVSDDGQKIISCSEDESVRVWDLNSGELLWELKGHSRGVFEVAISPDGRVAFSGSEDRTVRVWDVEEGLLKRTLEGHAGSVKALVVVDAGERVLSGAGDRTVRHWDLGQRLAPASAVGHPDPVTMIATSTDGKRAISVSRDGRPRVWDTENGDSLGELAGLSGQVVALRIDAHGNRAVAGDSQGAVRVWDLVSGDCVRVVKAPSRWPRRMMFSSDATRGLAWSRDRSLHVWDLATGQHLRVLVTAGNEKALAALRQPGSMLPELAIGRELDITPEPHNPYSKFIFSPDGEHVLMTSPTRICGWDLKSGVTLHENTTSFAPVAMAVDDAGRLAIIGSEWGGLRIWDMAVGETRHQMHSHRTRIIDLVVLPDSREAITAARDGAIRICDLDSGEVQDVLDGERERVEAVAIAADGTFAYAVRGDTITVADIKSCSRRASLSLDHHVTALAVSPDGKQITVGDESGRVHFLWLQE